MRHKQRLGAAWLLLPLVAGLPIAVFLSWKEQKPPAQSSAAAVQRSGDAATRVPEISPDATLEKPADAQPEADAEAPGPAKPARPPNVPVPAKRVPDVVPAPRPETPQEEKPAETVNQIPPAPAPPRNIDWAEIAIRPARWPTQTRTKVPVDFPITVDGKRSGATRVPAGANVKVVKILEDGVEVAFAEYSTKVDFDQTTVAEQVVSPPSRPEQAPQAPERPAPERPASTPKPTPTPKIEGAAIMPQQKWQSPPGDGRAALVELLKVLKHETRSDDSLLVAEHPEIYRGVTLMMPLRKALAQLGAGSELIPSRVPISHPGIPLYLRTFPCKSPLVGEPEDSFNVMNVVTDADDFVVALQFVCEYPRSKMSAPKEEYQTYNFLLERRKASRALKVGCDVSAAGNDVLLIESWLFDGRHDKCLEIVRWYLPKRVADFLRHVIETRLAL